MVRRSFAAWILMLVVTIIAILLILNLFVVNDKSWGAYALAVAGFASLPILSTLYIRTINILPASKVVIITAIWATWVVLAGIGAFATYYYWYNNGTSYNSCVNGLCGGINLLNSH